MPTSQLRVLQRHRARRVTRGNRNLCVTGKYHILIVDDDKVGRKFIRRRFQRLFPDAIVEEAVSGEEAVAKAKERDIAYDIITMDHFMAIGDMNGAETIKALREAKVDAVIIGISGNAKEGEHLSAGAENFLQKPIPSDTEILDMILAHLAPPNGWQVLIVDDVHMNTQVPRSQTSKDILAALYGHGCCRKGKSFLRRKGL